MKLKEKIKNSELYKKISEVYQKKGKKQFIINIILIFIIAIITLILIFGVYIIISAPEFDKDKLYKKNATVIYDVHGKELARIGEENRELITYNDLPQVFIDALVATEDSRFFQHNGLDIARFIKASFGQILGQDAAGGASTITMQLVKNTYTSNTAHGIKGLIRKFTDIYMAVFKIESSYTKEEILEFYANSLWLGNDGNLNSNGIFGVEQASQFYFGKSVSELSLPESSLLVGMYQNATLYNPYRNPEGCKNRQKTVLKLMVNHGYITEEEMELAAKIPIESLLKDPDTATASNENQAAIDYILAEVQRITGNNPYLVPMQIYSTIDMDVQKVLKRLEDGEFHKYYVNPDDEPEEGTKKVLLDQEGTAVTSVIDGSIVGLSGGRNYQARGLNRATDIERQPGSTAKPIFDYGPSIEFLNASTGDYYFDDPYEYTNGTPIADADQKYQGMITMREAIIGSRNIPALQAFQKVYAEDPELIANYVHSFGIDYGPNLFESASVGGIEKGVSPLAMSAAYAVYGRGGYYIEPYIFTKVIYEDGTSYDYKYTKERVVSEQTAYMITDILVSTVEAGWVGRLKISGTQVAGKTGTTNLDNATKEKMGLHSLTIPDSWSITYNPEYCIAMWYGFDSLDKHYYQTATTGGNFRSAAMPALARNIYSTNKTFTEPSGIVKVKVEKYTYPLQLPSLYTPKDMIIEELFKEGTEPTDVSFRYQQLEDPANVQHEISGNMLTISWDEIATPKAIDHDYLQKYFNNNYGRFAAQYYEKRIKENTSQFGDLGYAIYTENEDGTLNEVAWLSTPLYTVELVDDSPQKYIIKTEYKKFKANASSGVTVEISE